jgi:hypothetical protein
MMGGEDGRQTDGAVADHGDRGARVDPRLDRGMVAGQEHVGQGEQ